MKQETTQSERHELMSAKTALFLALFGYVPFFLLVMAIGPLNADAAHIAARFGMSDGFFAKGLTAYSAVILSFLGGIRWGVAMVGAGDQKLRTRELVFSVIPSLAAWVAVFMPLAEGLFYLAVCFALQGLWDYKLGVSGRTPIWFLRLRVILTFLVSSTLFIAILWAG